MFEHVIPVVCGNCQGEGCRRCGDYGCIAYDKAPYEGEDKCTKCIGYGYVIIGTALSRKDIGYNIIDDCSICNGSGQATTSKHSSEEDSLQIVLPLYEIHETKEEIPLEKNILVLGSQYSYQPEEKLIIDTPLEELTQERIFKAINKWEEEAGEDFTDYFDGRIIMTTFMPWALGKRYINPDQFDLWVTDYQTNRMLSTADSILGTLYNHTTGEHIPYAVVESENLDWNETDQAKAYMILAEFISEITVYKERFRDFIVEDYESYKI